MNTAKTLGRRLSKFKTLNSVEIMNEDSAGINLYNRSKALNLTKKLGQTSKIFSKNDDPDGEILK